jgi:hypothetical protein
MKDVKQIREQFDLITEKEEKEDRKLSALVRAGLYDAKKLPALKRALEKSADKITSQEKRMLINLLDSLISQVVSDDQVYRKVRQNVHNVNEAKMDTYSKFDPRYKAGWPTDKEMPSVLILKRKAIRVYPDNQKVALYYSQALDKYVTIPYNDIQFGLNEAKKPEKETPEERKRRIAAALAGGSRTGKMLRTGKILPSQKSLRTRISAAAKNISDVSQRSGKAIAAGVATGNILKAALKAPFKTLRVKSTEKKLQDRLAKRKETKLVARRKEVRGLTKAKRQEAKATSRRKEVRDLTKAKRQEAKAATPTAAKPTVPTLKTRSPKAAAKIMAANPNIDYSAAAKNHAAKANVTEMFNQRLNTLRTEEQVVANLNEANNILNDKSKFNPRSLASRIRYQGALASKKTKPYKQAATDKLNPEPGNYTVNKLKDKAETFARRATGNIGDLVGLTDPKRGEGLATFNPGAAKAGDLAGAALTIGTGPSRTALKGAEVVASASKLADKTADAAGAASKADKTADAAGAASKAKKGKSSKFSKSRNLSRRVLNLVRRAGTLAAGVAGAAGAAGGNNSSYVLSTGANPELGKSTLFKSGSGFSNTTDAEKATQERTRQAQVKALATEQNSSYVLSTGKDPKFGLKTRTSSSSTDKGRRRNLTATQRRIETQQYKALTATNESVIDTIKNMVTNNIQETKLSFNEQEITINNTVAKKLLTVYESINKTNKKKMEQMLNENATSFNKVLMFAVRQ